MMHRSLRSCRRLIAKARWVRVVGLVGTAALLQPSSVLRANVVGGDLQNFNPAPSGMDYVTVQSAETLEPGFVNVSAVINHAVNSLPYFEEEDTQSRLRANDSLTMLDVGAAVGIMPGLEVGAGTQNLIRQRVDGGASHGEFSGSGMLNYRIYSKLGLYSQPQGRLAAMLTGVFDRVTNNPYVGINGSPIGVIEFAYDTRLLGTAIALNLGYRFRRKGQPIPGVSILPMGNQYLASLGLSYLLPFVDTKLIVEAFGSRPAEGATSGIRARQASSAELLAGVKHDLTTNASVHFGGGTELINGASSPDWRAYVGINWAFGPAFTPESRGKILQPSAPKEEKAVVRSINFDSGSDRVPPAAVAMLQTLADEITAKPFSKVYVEGHTDSVGSADANRRLSLRRAQGVRQWLITKGKIPADKIEALGVGEDSPIADNGNFQGRALNRRVEFRVIR